MKIATSGVKTVVSSLTRQSFRSSSSGLETLDIQENKVTILWGNSNVMVSPDKANFTQIIKINYSRLSLNGHLYKTDTSLKRTPRVGPVLYSLYLTLYKMDISLR